MKRIISAIIILTLLFSVFAVTASAAREEEFLSEVALVYEDSVEEAKKAIEGTDWKLLEYDLNANADYWFDDGVYLIYKTSSDVEDAITDLRVMDMYGGYRTSSYEEELEKSRAEYTKMINDLRTIAAEFKACYEAGDEMAKLAYRQMNYYKDKKTEGGTETDMLMGDFFLNMPTDDKVVQVIFEGNTLAVDNLISLLAISLSGQGSSTLAEKIAAQYANKDALTDEEYYDDAVALKNELMKARAKIVRYDSLADKYNLDDDNIPEEEYQFLTEYAAIAVLLDQIMLGETSVADIIREGDFEVQDIYPIIAAMTEGQKALVNMGMLEILLKYNSPSDSVETLKEMLDEIEKPYLDENGVFKTIDVYVGVDRSIFKGKFAMTNEAYRKQALTGETWDFGKAVEDSITPYIFSGYLTVLEGALVGTIIWHEAKIAKLASLIEQAWAIDAPATLDPIALNAQHVKASGVYKHWAPTLKGVSIAVAMIIVGTTVLSTWYNYYNPNYLAIPDTLVDVRETDVGNKYIKYDAAKVFGDDGKKNADFNAYEGKEWNALYYTKDANAGNSLTPNFAFSESSDIVVRRYQGVSMFGETNAFDLNSHVYDEDAKGAYLTVRYSATKKAAADLPTVVGSMYVTGVFYMLTAIGGVGVGIGTTLLVQRGKKKKQETSTADESVAVV